MDYWPRPPGLARAVEPDGATTYLYSVDMDAWGGWANRAQFWRSIPSRSYAIFVILTDGLTGMSFDKRDRSSASTASRRSSGSTRWRRLETLQARLLEAVRAHGPRGRAVATLPRIQQKLGELRRSAARIRVLLDFLADCGHVPSSLLWPRYRPGIKRAHLRLLFRMRIGRGSWAVVVAVPCFGIALAAASNPSPDAQSAPAVVPVSFNRDIRPILANNCFACHGPDEKHRETKFHFDTEDGAFAKRGVIVPGKAADSLLVQRITNPDPDEHMPPPDSGHALTDKQIDLLRRWIDEGAKWDTHWAYVPPKRVDPPAVSRPAVGAQRRSISSSSRGSTAKGCKPSPEADKVTLLRRVTYDLTGLPPTPAEIDAFLADTVARRLRKARGRTAALAALRRADGDSLARCRTLRRHPRLSHRQPARHVAVARLGDRRVQPQHAVRSSSRSSSSPAICFPTRPRSRQIASGFNRNHMINFEGGAIAEEYQVEYVIDRVEATSSAFMGLTMGCARCHSHKFDPITHKEFYQFFAFFNTVPEQGLDGQNGNAEPVLPLPSADAAGAARRARRRRSTTTKSRARPTTSSSRCSASGKQTVSDAPPSIDTDGLIAHYEMDGSFSDISGRYQHGRTVTGDPTFDDGPIGKAASFDGDTEVSFGNVGAFDRAIALQRGAVAEGPRQPADERLPEARRPAASPRIRVAFRRRRRSSGIQKYAAQLTIALRVRRGADAIRIRTQRSSATRRVVSRRADLRRIRQSCRASDCTSTASATTPTFSRTRCRVRSRRTRRCGSAARRSASRSTARSTTCGSTARS